MSSYRPKSLDELNSRYDQAMSADMAIKKGVSGIKESENQLKENRFSADTNDFDIEAEGFAKRISSPKSVEDISGAVDDFIRHLNNEYAPETVSARPQPKPVPQTAQPVSPKKSVPVAEPEPMNDERSELLDNYMKVMTDQYEDDDEPAGGYLKKKGRKRRKEKTAETVREQEPIIPDKSEPLPLPEVDYNNAGYMMNNNEPAEYEEQGGENEADTSFENLDTAFDQLDEQAVKAKPKKGKGRVFLRTLFSLMLVAVIAATAAVASLVLVFKVNTGNVVFGKYCFVTTSATFEEANLKAGDIVICEAVDTIKDGQFVLCIDKESTRPSFFFGKKNGEMIDAEGNKMSLVDGQKIYEENIVGRVKRSFGHVGTVIDFIFRYYVPVLGALLILAIGLILLVAVVLRNKSKSVVEFDETDSDEKANEEDGSFYPASDGTEEPQPETEYEPSADVNGAYEEESGTERKSKKKKRRKDKKKKSSEPEEAPESDETEAEESESFDINFDSYSDI